MMKSVFAGVRWSSRLLHGIAGICLVFLMLLTIADVILRKCWKPIAGTYELVGFAGALAIALAMPFTSWIRGHVYVDFLVNKLPDAARNTFHVITRLLAMALFALLALNLFRYGLDLRASGEVSLTLELPFYPVAFGFAVASMIQTVVLCCDIVKILRGEYE